MTKAKLARKAKDVPVKTLIPGIPDMVTYIACGVLLLAAIIAVMAFRPSPPPVVATPAATLPPVTPPAAVPTTADQATRPLAGVSPAERANRYSAPPATSLVTGKKYQATIVTDRGNIVVDLAADKAPQTVNNFVFLARQGFYDGLTFHRVEPNFVIQGGDPLGIGTGGPGYTVPAEIGLLHTDGAIAMARQGDEVNPKRESSGSQFYISLGAQAGLDNQYTVFGQVVAGLDVTRQIQRGDVIRRIDISEQ